MQRIAIPCAPAAAFVAVFPSGQLSLISCLPESQHGTHSDEDARAADRTGEGEERPRALVVDDAPDITEMMAMFLRHAGYEVAVAGDGAEALEAARRARFDVIVSDIGMPGMDGYELAQALRALPAYGGVPIIAVTGFSMYDDSRRATQCGFDAHMTKPIDPVALLEIIDRLRD